ncbi:MAG: adenylate/guanylate cyclase domain-containing protein [Pseudomonadota bacterium]
MLKRSLPFMVGAIAFALLLGVRVADPEPLKRLRAWVFDLYQEIEPRAYQPAGVRIVDIDEASLQRYGQWPWPRNHLADLVTALHGMGAATVAFDVVFAESDRMKPTAMLRTLVDAELDTELQDAVRRLPDPDRMFGKAIWQNRVVLGFAPTGAASERLPDPIAGIAVRGPDPAPILGSYAGATVNLAPFEAVAAGNGSFGIRNDFDAILRRVPLYQSVGGTIYPSLSAEALRVAQGARSHLLKTAEGRDGEVTMVAARIGQVEVPTTAAGELYLHDTGFVAERYLPAWQVLDPGRRGGLRAQVEGHIVLVGTSAAGLKDLRATPLSPIVPGVSLHAQALEQMILGHHLLRPDWADGLEVVAMIGLGLVLVTAIPLLGPTATALVGAAAAAGGLGASWYAFSELQMLFDPLYPIAAALGVYLPMTAIQFIMSDQEKRFVRGAFSRYLSPALVKQMAKNPKALVLGGEDRELTLLFSDIRGFTTISERMTPAELIGFMNHYFSVMSAEILDREGFIDKYIGDAIMAFWNAPLDVAQHPRRACETALAMRDALTVMNTDLSGQTRENGEGYDEVRIGLGLHTGVCRVGNMGSQQRLNYSVLGDDVNLTARLEGQTKIYGVDILLSEATRDAAGPGFETVELDKIRVKGRAKPVRIFVLAGTAEALAGTSFPAYLAAQNRLIDAYRRCAWPEAEAALDEVYDALAVSSDWRPASLRLERVAEIYSERIALLKDDPPPSGWDQVFNPRREIALA